MTREQQIEMIARYFVLGEQANQIVYSEKLYGDNVIEKCGKGRDDTGDIGKHRNFNGKSEHFRRERPAFHK